MFKSNDRERKHWYVGPVSAIYLLHAVCSMPRSTSVHVWHVNTDCPLQINAVLHTSVCVRLTCSGVMTNTKAGISAHRHICRSNSANVQSTELTDCVPYLVFALVHCKTKSFSSKPNLSNRLCECVFVEFHHIFRTHTYTHKIVNKCCKKM